MSDFYEDDELTEKIVRAFEQGEQGTTEEPASDRGYVPPVLQHGDGVSTQALVDDYLAEKELSCSYRDPHDHGGHGLHHHHTLECLIDAGKNELIPITMELFETKSSLKLMTEMVQRDQYTRQVLEPLVDLVYIWREESKRPEELPVEVVVSEFSAHTARLLYEADGLLDVQKRWIEQQREKREANKLDESDASR